MVLTATVSSVLVDCSLLASSGSYVLLSGIRLRRNGDMLTWESSFGRILTGSGFGSTDYKFTEIKAIRGVI